MVDLPFDTMAAVRNLRDTGLDQKQAEAIAATVQKGISGGVATKADIIRLESDMRVGFAEMRVGFAKIESDVKWIKLIGGVIVAALVLPLFADFILDAWPDGS